MCKLKQPARSQDVPNFIEQDGKNRDKDSYLGYVESKSDDTGGNANVRRGLAEDLAA
jgi:hypothetical protein